MYRDEEKVFAFEPVVRELKALLSLFKTITWIGFNREDKRQHAAYTEIQSKKIQVILLNKVGGTSLKNKLSILGGYPTMCKLIDTEIKKHPVIHSRAPSNPAYIAMWLSKKYPSKRFWFKYAGNWTQSAPFFYTLQRNKLKRLSDNCVVTVNGRWKHQPSNVIPFDNPCLNETDRESGKKCIDRKTLQQGINYCFVGGLNENKGILLLLEAFNTLKITDFKGSLHIIGDGPLREEVQEKVDASLCNIILHGALSKAEVCERYKQCDFLILPSKSEGFPKVISEAMNFGCIPIVSNISCIDQYIQDGKNGFLIDPLSVSELQQCLAKTKTITKGVFKKIIEYNYDLAGRFTYRHYKKRIQQDILNHKTNKSSG
jgi:glycosyltransferase involved in cell wall biosynthesis